MVINRRPPRYPRRGPSCLLILTVIAAFFAGAFIVSNAEEVRTAILPAPTPVPTKSPASYATSAKLYWRDGEFLNAIDAFEDALVLDPGNVDYYSDLIDLYVITKQSDKALELVTEAIDLAPENDEVWTVAAAAYLANADRQSGRGQSNGESYQQAVEAGRNATQLNPNNALAYAYMAAGLIEQGPSEWAQATEMIESSLALDPNDPVIQYHYATVLTYQGYYETARDQLELALSENANFTNLHLSLSRIYFFYDNERQRAILILKDALEVDPDNAELHDALAYFYLVAGEYPNAEVNARQAVDLDPTMVRAQAHLGHAYYQQNNYELAIDHLEQAVDGYQEPTSTTSLYFAMLGLAYYFEDTAQCSQATPLFNLALANSTVGSPGEISALEGIELCRQATLSGS